VAGCADGALYLVRQTVAFRSLDGGCQLCLRAGRVGVDEQGLANSDLTYGPPLRRHIG
jgi:hypothetical protein